MSHVDPQPLRLCSAWLQEEAPLRGTCYSLLVQLACHFRRALLLIMACYYRHIIIVSSRASHRRRGNAVTLNAKCDRNEMRLHAQRANCDRYWTAKRMSFRRLVQRAIQNICPSNWR
eukprot:4890278-Pyramimonas_sp.AAC.1